MTEAPRPRTGLERFTVTRWFALVVGGLVLVAAVGLVIGVLALARLSSARVLLVDGIDPAVVAAERLETAVVDEETGVRGYALSGDRAFLRPYRLGRVEEEQAYARLAALGADPDLGPLRADLGRTRTAAVTWRERYAEPTVRALEAAGAVPSTAEGKRLFDELRAAVVDLQDSLDARRADARHELDRTADLVLGLFLLAGALLLLAVLAAGAALRATILAPLARLANGVRRVAGGDFGYALRPTGPREIADLGRDVDAMRARIVDEVAALREAEAALTRQAEDLRRSNAELEQFAYVASHDLQEPLRKVASFTQMLQRRYENELDERAHRYIEFAVDGAKRMQELINDLLAFSRVGRVTTVQERVALGEIAARAAANVESASDEASAVVEIGALPSVNGDGGLLTVVFQNLIANAIKFRRPDRRPHVVVDAERTDGEWRIEVTDNGIGVEPEYADRIFIIFQRLHTRTAYEGTGIGLAMCRKIIEYHGGRIWLGPPPDDGGSRFCFTLPAADEEEDATHERAGARGVDRGPAGGGRPR
jgi:signal transduction histidine kinase